jgi:hypothetical protein
MARKTTFGDLHRLLQDHGFDLVLGAGPYIVFKHEPSGALQAFRAHRLREVVDAMTLASVHKTLVGFGFLDDNGFERALHQVTAERERHS